MEPSIDPVFPQKSKWTPYIIVTVVIIIIAAIYSTHSGTAKVTLEDKLTQLKELRADKTSHQKAIYLDDQKIVPLKCSIYSDVGAKEQWNLECQDYFNDQQSKMKEAAVIPASTPAEVSVSETFDE